MDFFPEIDVSETQAEAIARGLMVVARADGKVHEREATLIAELFSSATQRPSDLGALERAPGIPPEALALALPTPELRRLFLKTAMLLAYTDGSYGPGEAKSINEFARALGAGEPELRLLETQVKEYLLGQLSHLENTDALVEVSKELKASS